MSLVQRTTIGILWNFGEQLARRGLGVLVTLLLAYFLSPEDYALVAMLAVFVALGASLMDSGFNAALIRLPNASNVDFNTAFIANVVLGGIAYFFLFIFAPLIAEFYGEPRLVNIVRVASLSILLNSIQGVQVAKLNKKLNYKVQAKVFFTASFLSGLSAIGLAFSGYGVWALIFQGIISSVFGVLFLWRKVEWRPEWCFSFVSFKKMYSFGYKLFLSGTLDTIFKNIYVVVIAKIFTAKVAGLYFFADRIKEMLVSQLVHSIAAVTYPALSTIQNDSEKLKQAYRKILMIMTFILFPCFLLVAVQADSLLQAFFPEKWWAVSNYLQLLLCASILHPIHMVNLNILKIKGRSDLFLYLEIIKKTIVVLVLLVSYRYGVEAILVGQIINSILAYIPNSYFSLKLINYGIGEQMKDVLPVLALSILVAFIIHVCQSVFFLEPWVELVVYSFFGVAIYILLAWVLKLKALLAAKEIILIKWRA